MATTNAKTSRLTLHKLLGAVSFWGSSVRLLLLAFLVAIIFGLRLTYLDTTLTWEAQVVIYVLGSFALLDIGYVMLARAFPLDRQFDLLSLFLLEALLFAAYILPNITNVPSLGWLSNWILLVVLLALAIRGLIGLLFARKK